MTKTDKSKFADKICRILKYQGGIEACATIVAYCRKRGKSVDNEALAIYVSSAKRMIAKEKE